MRSQRDFLFLLRLKKYQSFHSKYVSLFAFAFAWCETWLSYIVPRFDINPFTSIYKKNGAICIYIIVKYFKEKTSTATTHLCPTFKTMVRYAWEICVYLTMVLLYHPQLWKWWNMRKNLASLRSCKHWMSFFLVLLYSMLTSLVNNLYNSFVSISICINYANFHCDGSDAHIRL